MFTFWICTRALQWSCLKVVSVSTFVLGGLRGFTATSDLVRRTAIFSFFYKEDKVGILVNTRFRQQARDGKVMEIFFSAYHGGEGSAFRAPRKSAFSD